jgi:hypothetical protein
MHYHVWRIGTDSSPKETKKELLSAIIKCGSKGYWLREGEIKFGKELQLDGLVKLCCESTAATII